MTKTSVWDKLQTMADSERPRATVIELLEEVRSDIRTLSEALGDLADTIDETEQYVSSWQEAETEDKADARQELIDNLLDIIEKKRIIDEDIPSFDEIGA